MTDAVVDAGRRYLPRGWSHFGLQLVIWFGFLGAYQIARGLAPHDPARAFANGLRVIAWEQTHAHHLIEVSFQNLAASSRLLARLPFAASAVAFSEDGRRVLASGTHAAYLWELGEDDAWPQPIMLPAEIGGGGFTADGRWLITRSYDTGTVGVWTLKPDELLSLACRTAARNLTDTEWDKYFPGQAYAKTCPDQP